jgi:hypothetical protein
MSKLSSPQHRIFDTAERVMFDCLSASKMLNVTVIMKVERELKVVRENSWPSVYEPILATVINQASGK